MKTVVAILDSMWDWRQATSRAGYKEAPRSFSINPRNFSGKRLYRIVGDGVNLLVTNSCRELCASANHHGTPDPAWLRENLKILEPFEVLLVCGKVAQATYAVCGYEFKHKIEIPHPAARMWTHVMLADAAKRVRVLLGDSGGANVEAVQR
jgi:hypothetical protein